MSGITDRLRKCLRTYNDIRLAVRAKVRQRDEALLKRIGLRHLDGRPTMSRLTLYLHSLAAFALFACAMYWLAVTYMANGQKLFCGAVFIPFLVPIIYLVTVHFLSKKK